MSTIERISGAVLPLAVRGRGAATTALGCEWASLQVQSLQPDSLVEGLGRWAPWAPGERKVLYTRCVLLPPAPRKSLGTFTVGLRRPVKWRVNECVKLKVLISTYDMQTPNRRHNGQRSHACPRHHTMNSNARSWWFGSVWCAHT